MSSIHEKYIVSTGKDLFEKYTYIRLNTKIFGISKLRYGIILKIYAYIVMLYINTFN